MAKQIPWPGKIMALLMAITDCSFMPKVITTLFTVRGRLPPSAVSSALG
jgi:hypothetical protein